MLLSAAAIAGSDGLLELPEFYRTPLSEVIYEEHTTWRATPKEDNGWRRKDDEGIQTMKNLGRNMAWLLKKLHDE